MRKETSDADRSRDRYLRLPRYRPRLTRTGGRARFYARLGVRRYDRAPEAATRPEPGYLDLVLFDRPAEVAHELYRRGDDVLALGRLIPAVPDLGGGQGREAQFIVERLGPDTNHLSVTIRCGKDAA